MRLFGCLFTFRVISDPLRVAVHEIVLHMERRKTRPNIYSLMYYAAAAFKTMVWEFPSEPQLQHQSRSGEGN